MSCTFTAKMLSCEGILGRLQGNCEAKSDGELHLSYFLYVGMVQKKRFRYLPCYVTWIICRSRNALIFEKKPVKVREDINKAITLYNEMGSTMKACRNMI